MGSFASANARTDGDTTRYPDRDSVPRHCPGSVAQRPGGKPDQPTTIRSKELKWEYEALRDSVARLRLPADYRMNDSKAGISTKDREQAAVLARSGKFIETGLKLMGEVQKHWNRPSEMAEYLDGVLLSMTAHMRYLQEEHGALYVAGQYGDKTKNIYRSMQRCTSNLQPEDIENLKTAVSITPQPVTGTQPQNQQFNRGSFRQSWRGRGHQQYYGGNTGGQRGGFGGGFRGRNGYGYQPRGVPYTREGQQLPPIGEDENNQ